ncbi:C4-type zinc ribbon domain-containing protein [Nocardioides sp. TRM66260-LWL]|uniref:zinc ribbon domain-containing protein n=1 Tax=Nocardioides sp. TRM66260-LWL TaxID=2874478 RepID=UPI001CC5DB02|nr:C4-type zinc ribbon domain-containing protein [Nocardioides sp. TRM66260-LWL]MBZ5736462.1 C4-type zinc ribbon domain-containing protein [Nocardioides sp. TRM66260-LWL]
MRAEPSVQLELLELQDLDTSADQLRHQRRSVPELAEIAAVTKTRAELAGRATDHRIVVDDLASEQSKVDADVEQARARRDRDQARVDAGQVTDPKSLERLVGELASLERRIRSLEDDELEVMERVEAAQGALDAVTAEIAELDERLAALTAARDERFAEIDARLADVERSRGPFAEAIPADLLALYEKLRAAKGGIGAARLHQRRCTGCQITLDAAVLGEIRKAPTDQVLRCEECSRILVRTSESGL